MENQAQNSQCIKKQKAHGALTRENQNANNESAEKV